MEGRDVNILEATTARPIESLEDFDPWWTQKYDRPGRIFFDFSAF